MAESPFPGMDPFMETDWSDVQCWLSVAISSHLNECLPRSLAARVGLRELAEPSHFRCLKVRKFHRTGDTELIEPDLILEPALTDPLRQHFVEIVDAVTRRGVSH